jgi:hypothetical protein
MECLICGGQQLSVIVAGSSFEFIYGKPIVRYKCSFCDVIFGPMEWIYMSKQELGAKYMELFNTGWKEADSTGPEWESFSALSPQPNKKYLNWGAGASNRTAELAKDNNFNVSNYDPFNSNNNNNSVVVNGLYDGIFSNNVIEHLQNPIADLLYMKSFLNPNGKMAHATGCYKYVAECSIFHLYFLCGKSAGILAAKIGMSSRVISDRIVLFE